MRFASQLLGSVAWCGVLMAAATPMQPATALTITPVFDSFITGAPDAASVEYAINAAISTIESLYSNPGTIGIVFTQSAGSFVGESETADYGTDYPTYVSLLAAASARQPTNTTLATALANLSTGNKPGAGGSVLFTTADAQLALGLTSSEGVTGCFNSSGTFVAACGQAEDGVVVISSSVPLNYTTTPVAGEYSAISGMEHEIDEILGGGGQGSMLNAIDHGEVPSNDLGVLDLYRYSAPGVPSFSTSGGATAYLSVDGGNTNIVGFNQNSGGDFGDFSNSGDVQSAFGTPGIVPAYTTASPEYEMMQAIGYDGAVPEPASLAVLGAGLAGLLAARRRRRAGDPDTQ